MLENNAYNLMSQLIQESQSLWRIKDTYKKDAVGCSECLEFWDKMEKEKAKNIDELTELIKKHLD